MFNNSESERRFRDVDERVGHVPALDSDFRLTLPARPENIAVVRHVTPGRIRRCARPVTLPRDLRHSSSRCCSLHPLSRPRTLEIDRPARS